MGLSPLTGKEINVETMGGPSLYRTKTQDNLSHLETVGARVEYGDQEYEIDLFDLDPGDGSASYQVDVRRIEREKDDELLNGDGNALDLDAGGNQQNTEWKGVKSSTHIGSVYDEEIEEAAKKIYNHIRLDNLW